MDRMLSNEALLSAKAAAKKASESAQYAINLIDVGEPEQAITAIECGTAKAMEAVNHFSRALTVAYEQQIPSVKTHGDKSYYRLVPSGWNRSVYFSYASFHKIARYAEPVFRVFLHGLAAKSGLKLSSKLQKNWRGLRHFHSSL